ncbi:MAG: ABC transporter ATP-binding protein [Candidatus Humimicrobiaceae bacterium]
MINKVKIKVDNVSKIFNLGKGKYIEALENFNLEIFDKEFLAIVGPSGCGKSTLLFMIAGIEEPTKGSIYYENEKIIGTSLERGVVFQSDAVFPWMTVRENIEYGPRIRKISNEKIKEIGDNFLKLVELEKFENVWPKQLSGGMRKRVDLARALANNPDVLLMDEPFGALDVITKENLQIEIDRLFSEFNKTIFFVTHDLEEAIFLADRVIVVTDSPGKIKTSMKINFSRPRLPEIKTTLEFQKLRAQLNKFISGEYENKERDSI